MVSYNGKRQLVKLKSSWKLDLHVLFKGFLNKTFCSVCSLYCKPVQNSYLNIRAILNVHAKHTCSQMLIQTPLFAM